MASEPPPGNPRPDQTPPPAGSHARPASLPPSADWLDPANDTAEPLPDDVLFDELIAEAEPIDGSHADGLVDLNQVESDMSHASGATYISDPGMEDPAAEEPETIFPPRSAKPAAESPPPSTSGPDTDWLDGPLALEGSSPFPVDLGAPTSDVLLGHQRDTSEDALGEDGFPHASNSSIFEAPQGSSRFDNPTDPTEPVPDFASLGVPPPSDLLVDIEESGSSGQLFGPDPMNPLDAPDAEDIGGGLLSDSSDASGAGNGDSSIFGHLPSPESNLAAADLLAGAEEETNEDIHGEVAVEPSSHIFMRDNEGPVEEHNVSFALPPADPDDAVVSGATSGLIDWGGTPSSTAKLSDRLTREQADAEGVPDLATLASQANTPRPAATPAPARRTQSQPAQPAARPAAPAAKKRGLAGWLGGTAVGLLAGVGLSAGAYLGGVVPNSEAKPSTQQSADALTRQLADANRQAEEAKDQAAKAKKDGAQTVDDLVKAQQALATTRNDLVVVTSARDKAARDLSTARKSLDESKQMLTTAQRETQAAVGQAREDGKKALAEQAKLLEVARKDLADKSTMLTAAEARVADAITKQRAADEVLANVVTELKTAKLIDDKDDAQAAIAKLPDVLKKASAAAASADAQKAAAALLAAKKDTELAQAEAKAAKDVAAKAEAALKQATRDADKAVLAAQAEVKTAVAAAEAGWKAKLADAIRDRQQAERDFDAKLAAKEEEHRSQLAAARAGVILPLSSGELKARERAMESFNAGVDAYFAGRYDDAEAALLKATQLDGSDARSWYFLGLTHFQRRNPAATEAFKRAGELEGRNQPPAKLVTIALERVQGPARQALNPHRP